MKKCISFGKIEKKFIYLILAYFLFDICIIICSINFENYSDIDFYVNNRIINEIMSYMIQSFFYIFEFIRNKKNSLSIIIILNLIIHLN